MRDWKAYDHAIILGAKHQNLFNSIYLSGESDSIHHPNAMLRRQRRAFGVMKNSEHISWLADETINKAQWEAGRK
jgi:hypothetical protein